jgi:hypothetical protein
MVVSWAAAANAGPAAAALDAGMQMEASPPISSAAVQMAVPVAASPTTRWSPNVLMPTPPIRARVRERGRVVGSPIVIAGRCNQDRLKKLYR